MFVEVFLNSLFPSDTLIYGISRGGSKNSNIRTCEHVILDQLRMGARQTKNAPLGLERHPPNSAYPKNCPLFWCFLFFFDKIEFPDQTVNYCL